MAPQAVAIVPSIQRSVYAATSEEGRNFGGPNEAVEWISQREDAVAVCMMGGPAQPLYERIRQIGIPVHRIPWHMLYKLSGLEKGASAEEYASALLRMWETSAEAFYP